MMSLFSPFDTYFFSKTLWSFMFVFFSFMIFYYKITVVSLVYDTLILNLSSFFYSLKSKSFNKSSITIFFTLFFMVCFFNFFSVFSFNFPFSSQVSVMLIFSFGVWASMIMFNIKASPNKLILHFIPEGAPMVLSFLLFLIEMVSNIIRPITLMVRLVANILAGHLLMILLSKLVFTFPYTFGLYIVLNMVEIFVSLIQSYIFVTMLVLYYSEV